MNRLLWILIFTVFGAAAQSTVGSSVLRNAAADEASSRKWSIVLDRCAQLHKSRGVSQVIQCAVSEGLAVSGLSTTEVWAMWAQNESRHRAVTAVAEWLLTTFAAPAELASAQHRVGVAAVNELVRVLVSPEAVARSAAGAAGSPSSSSSQSEGAYPYWRFIPPYKGSAIPGNGSERLTFQTGCFRNISVLAKWINGTAQLEYTASSQTGLLCVDLLLFSAAGKLHLDVLLVNEPNTRHAAITPDDAPGKPWLTQHRGVQTFSFVDLVDVIVSFLATGSLFLNPMTSERPSVTDALNNALFQNAYNTLEPLLEPVPGYSSSSGSQNGTKGILNPRTGDLLLVGRMDGQDTLAAWLMGSNVPHVAILVCNATTSTPSNKEQQDPEQCQVCETRFQSLWWPIDGVQCNALDNWLVWANNGAMLVTHLPSRDLASQMNVTAALAFMQQNQGVSYGYPGAIWGWIDRADGSNFPCFPPDFSSHCLAFEHLELVFLLLSASETFSSYLGGSGFSQRIGRGYSTPIAEALEIAFKQFGWTPQEVAARPELDNFVYASLKNGIVYYGPVWSDSGLVCTLLRESGPLATFPPEAGLNCAEQTVWNILRLDFWNASAATQVIGDYTLMPMNDVGTVSAYSKMGNDCPTRPPHYTRPENC